MARGQIVWLNGSFVAENEARISLFTHSLHYGCGAFEGIRCYAQSNGHGAVFRLQDHIIRLYESCKILDLQIPYHPDELIQAVRELCTKNHFAECYIRPIVFIGDGPLGVYPGANPPVEVALLCWEWGHYLGEEEVTLGAKLKISSFIRPHVNSIMTKGKITGQYVTGVLAKREAIESGYSEALLLDPEGFLTEGSGENLFVIKNGKVKTTALTSILDGITRRTVVSILQSRGIELIESRMTRDELWCADEAFLTGTAAEITPIRQIDNKLIGPYGKEGRPGPISLMVKSAYNTCVRGEPLDPAWLTVL